MMTTGFDEDEAAIRSLLGESDLDEDTDGELFGALLALRDLRSEATVMPSADVAALMSAGRKRRLGTRGAVVVALVAAATLGTGLSAAAAPQLRDNAQQAIAAFVHAVVPFAAPPARHGPSPKRVATAARPTDRTERTTPPPITTHPARTAAPSTATRLPNAVVAVPAAAPQEPAPISTYTTRNGNSDGRGDDGSELGQAGASTSSGQNGQSHASDTGDSAGETDSSSRSTSISTSGQDSAGSKHSPHNGSGTAASTSGSSDGGD